MTLFELDGQNKEVRVNGSFDFSALGGAKQILLDFIYPVGTYVAIENSNFNTIEKMAAHYGGTWEKVEGRFILGTSSSYAIGSTGGEATHTLTINEMPSHTHNLGYVNKGFWSSGSNWCVDAGSRDGWGNSNSVSSTGGGQAHNNMPPYRVAYIYKRLT